MPRAQLVVAMHCISDNWLYISSVFCTRSGASLLPVNRGLLGHMSCPVFVFGDHGFDVSVRCWYVKVGFRLFLVIRV